MRSLLIISLVAQFLISPTFAQDRPLFQPFRIGYPINGSFGDRLMANEALERDLRRIGLIASWHSFEDGLIALRALHTDEIDIALDIGLHEVILAKLEELSMVFVAERKHRDDSDADPDDGARRYTLTSEYFADRREDALLLIFRALQSVARSNVQSGTGRPKHLIRVAQSQAHYESAYEVNIATRRRLSASQKVVDELWAFGQIPRRVNFADVTYWMPHPDQLRPAAASRKSRPSSR